MAEKTERISIGFKGGQVVPVRTSKASLDGLREALAGDGWHQLDGDEGPIDLDLSQVAFVRLDSSEHRVGFG
jgi:hypothetical protein